MAGGLHSAPDRGQDPDAVGNGFDIVNPEDIRLRGETPNEAGDRSRVTI